MQHKGAGFAEGGSEAPGRQVQEQVEEILILIFSALCME